MKDSLIINEYQTEQVAGTLNLTEEKSFFGSKAMDIEDNIHITDKSIQYFEVLKSGSTIDRLNNGYQYYDINTIEESFIVLDIIDSKLKYHKIDKIVQNERDKKINTRWEINIIIKDILKEYLFSRIKESRVFKSMSYERFNNNDINESIYEYISSNLLDRYELENIELYVKYINLKDNVIYSNLAIKQYDPIFNQSIEQDEYKVSNANIKIDLYLDKLAPIKINYYQTKSSVDYKFDYYYNLHFKKI